MIPQAGSAYAYSYATLGELVAWIIGWDLILEYGIGNVAVAISWGDYFTTLLRGVGVDLPAWLTTGYRTALLSGNPEVRGLLDTAPQLAGLPLGREPAGVRDRHARDVAAAARGPRDLHGQQRHGRGEAPGARPVHRCRRDERRAVELHAVCAERVHGRPSGRRHRVFCLHRLRRRFHRGGGNQESAAQPADRHPGRTGRLHGHLHRRWRRSHRDGPRTGSLRSRIPWRGRSNSQDTPASDGWWPSELSCR